MKTIFPIYLLLAVLSLTILSSCAKKGFEANNFSSVVGNPDGNNGNSGNGQNPPPGSHEELAQQISNLDMRSYVTTGSYASTDPLTDPNPVTDLDKKEGQLIIRIPLGLASLFSVGTVGAHQKYKDIVFSVEGDLKTGFRLLVKIPLKYVLRLGQIENAALSRLPNGDPIPHIPTGELPMLNITVNPKKKEKIYLYLSKEYVGLLFESQFDPGINFEYALKDRNELRSVGFFNLMQAKNNAPAALMVSFPIPAKVSTLLDQYFLD